MLAVNVRATEALLEAARATGSRLVNAGTSSEYGLTGPRPRPKTECVEPNSHYAVTKVSATHLCRLAAATHAQHAVTLRLYSIYGPWEEPGRLMPTLVERAIAGGWPPLVDPETARDFVWVEDACEAFVLAASTILPHRRSRLQHRQRRADHAQSPRRRGSATCSRSRPSPSGGRWQQRGVGHVGLGGSSAAAAEGLLAGKRLPDARRQPRPVGASGSPTTRTRSARFRDASRPPQENLALCEPPSAGGPRSSSRCRAGDARLMAAIATVLRSPGRIAVARAPHRPLTSVGHGLVDVGCGAQPYRGLLPPATRLHRARHRGRARPTSATRSRRRGRLGGWPMAGSTTAEADVILATETLEHVLIRPAFLAEAHRCLRPGGADRAHGSLRGAMALHPARLLAVHAQQPATAA